MLVPSDILGRIWQLPFHLHPPWSVPEASKVGWSGDGSRKEAR